MTKIKVDMIRCDLCPRPAVTITICLPTANIDVDLCDVHIKPFLDVADHGRPSAARRVPRARSEPPIRISHPAE